MRRADIVSVVAMLASSIFVVVFVTTFSGQRGDTDCGDVIGSTSSLSAGTFKPMKTTDAVLTSGFGHRWGTMHNGIDLAGPLDAPIYAYADGVVSKAEPASGFGMWIVLDHSIDGHTFSTVYGHMFPGGVLVRAGDRVTAGQHIANEGNNGQTTGPHLHFEYYPGGWAPGNAVDPAPYYEAAADPGPSAPGVASPVTDSKVALVGGGAAEMAPLPPSVGSEDHFQVDTIRVARAAHARFPEITRIGGWRADGGGFDDHPSGRAADIMIDNWSSEEGTALGEAVKDYLWAHREALQIQYIIWRQQYIPVDGVPNMMEDRGSPTANHFDHVHVTTVGHGVPGPGQKFGPAPGGAGSTPGSPDDCRRDTDAPLLAGQVPAEFEKWLRLSATQCRELSPAILAAQLKQESGFRPGLVSPSGALGFAQFLPDTWASFGHPVDDHGAITGPTGAGDPNDIGDAVMAQGRYDCFVADTLRPGIEAGSITGDPVELMLAGYNAGPEAVQQSGGIPPFADTEHYVAAITAMAARYGHA